MFKSGFSYVTTPMEPGALYMPTITENSDGSYAISEEASASVTPASRRLSFSAFQLATHSGTLNYGGTPYSYIATKQ